MISVCVHSFALGSNEIDRLWHGTRGWACRIQAVDRKCSRPLALPNHNFNVNDPNQNKQIPSPSFQTQQVLRHNNERIKKMEKTTQNSGINYYNCHGFYTHAPTPPHLSKRIENEKSFVVVLFLFRWIIMNVWLFGLLL